MIVLILHPLTLFKYFILTNSKEYLILQVLEDFYSLTQLFCHNNQLQELDLSNNPNLFEVNCRFNQLVSLSVKNGNPTGLWYFRATKTFLLCVEVDNVAYAYYNWLIGQYCSIWYKLYSFCNR